MPRLNSSNLSTVRISSGSRGKRTAATIDVARRTSLSENEAQSDTACTDGRRRAAHMYSVRRYILVVQILSPRTRRLYFFLSKARSIAWSGTHLHAFCSPFAVAGSALTEGWEAGGGEDRGVANGSRGTEIDMSTQMNYADETWADR